MLRYRGDQNIWAKLRGQLELVSTSESPPKNTNISLVRWDYHPPKSERQEGACTCKTCTHVVHLETELMEVFTDLHISLSSRTILVGWMKIPWHCNCSPERRWQSQRSCSIYLAVCGLMDGMTDGWQADDGLMKFSWQEEVKSTTMTEERLRCSGCFYWTSTHRLDPLPTIDTQITSSQMSHIITAGPTSRGKGVLMWQPRNHMFPRLCLAAFSPGAFVHLKRKI